MRIGKHNYHVLFQVTIAQIDAIPIAKRKKKMSEHSTEEKVDKR